MCKNLSQMVSPFARLAIDRLQNIRPQMQAFIAALKPKLDSAAASSPRRQRRETIQALESMYRDWLTQRVDFPANPNRRRSRQIISSF
jgi:hypothetical protein